MDKSPKYISNSSGLLKILGQFLDFDEKDLEVGKGYIYSGNVYEYIDPSTEYYGRFPSIFYDAEGMVHAEPDISGKLISESEIKSNSLEEILSKTSDDATFYKENDIASIHDGEIYDPEIGDSDDFLKKIIKTVFKLKQTTVARFRRKFTKPYAFTNLFQGLNSSTKMSVISWQTWVELLGLNVTIIISDNGSDVVDSFDDVIIYESKNGIGQLKIVDQESLHDKMKDIEESIRKENN